jgi:hypothetical protein
MVFAVNHALARSTPDGSSGAAMELFLKLFGDLLVFAYHCFDRVEANSEQLGRRLRVRSPAVPLRAPLTESLHFAVTCSFKTPNGQRWKGKS